MKPPPLAQALPAARQRRSFAWAGLVACLLCQPGPAGGQTGEATPIKGTVLSPDGTPATGVQVRMIPFSARELTTDEQGRFEIPVASLRFPAQLQPMIVARDVARNLAVVTDADADGGDVKLQLLPGSSAGGRVLDDSENPLRNAQVTVMIRGNRISAPISPRPAQTDEEGRFEIPALPPGAVYTVQAGSRGYGSETREFETPEGGGKVDLGDLQLPVADQRLAGVVVDEEEQPVANAWVYASGEKQPHMSVQANSEGRFTMEKLSKGAVRLTANVSGGRFGTATAEAGETNVLIVMRSSGMLRTLGPRMADLKGKDLPAPASYGLTEADIPPGKPVIALLIDADQRPCRRAVKLLQDQSAALKESEVTVIVIQMAPIAEDRLNTWKQDTGLTFPIGTYKDGHEKHRGAWGAKSLPWILLAGKDGKVVETGVDIEELEGKIKAGW